MTEIKWRYCLEELPAYGEVIIKTLRRNEKVKDKYNTFPYLGLESYIGYLTVDQYRDSNSNLIENHGVNIEFWWISAKEFPWPQEILDLHSFDPPAVIMRYKPQDEET